MYANRVEFLSYDIEVLRQIKIAFPNDFTADVEIEEGIL
jgi:hypothetical protein